jgi:hypothetical protein
MSNLVLDDTVGEFGTRRGRKKDGGCGTGRNGKKEGKVSLRLQAPTRLQLNNTSLS